MSSGDFSIRKLLQRWKVRQALRKVDKLYRGQLKFSLTYPQYRMGIGSYGMPILHGLNDGTQLSIGAYTSIADEVHIFLGGYHRMEWLSQYPFPSFLERNKELEVFRRARSHRTTRGDVMIGNDVWLASGSTILSGITIGNGAVVAARSVVTKDVPPYAVVAGNPARIIRWRFPEADRAELERIAWWDWPVDEVENISPLLCQTDITLLIDYAKRRKHA